MSVWKSILTRLNNRGTILALAALIVSLLCQFGLDINSDKIMGTNNAKAYIPGISDKLIDKK